MRTYPSEENVSPATSRVHVVISASALGATVARKRLAMSSYSFHLSPFIFSGDAPAVGYIGGWSVVLLLPRDGTILSCARISSASDLNAPSFSFSRTERNDRLFGYSVFSVRG